MEQWHPAKLTALHHQHIELGATLLDEAGWKRPAFYAPLEQELRRVEGIGGFCDASPNGKLLLQGTALDAAVGPVPVGHCAYTSLSSGMQALICRLSDEEALVLTAPGDEGPAAADLAARLDGCAHLLDATSGYAGFQILGPRAGQALSRLTDLELRRLPDLSCVQGKLAEIHAILTRRDVGGQTSYEIYVERCYAVYLWETLLQTGHPLDVMPVGVEAIRRLRSGGA